MKRREDDFLQRRTHLQDLSDEELHNRFWALAEQVVEPMLELGRKNTTPSIERSVLLRMGFSSIECKSIVEGVIDRNLMGKGAGHVVYRLSQLREVSVREAGLMLIENDGWDEVVDSFAKKEDASC